MSSDSAVLFTVMSHRPQYPQVHGYLPRADLYAQAESLIAEVRGGAYSTGARFPAVG